MGDNNKGLTKSKARRQRDNKKKYELQAIKLAKKKCKVREKVVAKKAAWVKKDRKKNGKLVKGGKSHTEHLKEKAHGPTGSDENADSHGGGGDSTGGTVVQG